MRVHSITCAAVDRAGRRHTESRSFTVDSHCEFIAITSPGPEELLNSPSVSVEGRVSDSSELTVEVTVGGVATPASLTDGRFEAAVNLAEGTQLITAAATDAALNRCETAIEVTLDTVRPTLVGSEPPDDQPQ